MNVIAPESSEVKISQTKCTWLAFRNFSNKMQCQLHANALVWLKSREINFVYVRVFLAVDALDIKQISRLRTKTRVSRERLKHCVILLRVGPMNSLMLHACVTCMTWMNIITWNNKNSHEMFVHTSTCHATLWCWTRDDNGKNDDRQQNTNPNSRKFRYRNANARLSGFTASLSLALYTSYQTSMFFFPDKIIYF